MEPQNTSRKNTLHAINVKHHLTIKTQKKFYLNITPDLIWFLTYTCHKFLDTVFLTDICPLYKGKFHICTETNSMLPKSSPSFIGTRASFSVASSPFGNSEKRSLWMNTKIYSILCESYCVSYRNQVLGTIFTPNKSDFSEIHR